MRTGGRWTPHKKTIEFSSGPGKSEIHILVHEDENPDKKGNIRDEANVSQLVCLANLETLNAHFIHQALQQSERIKLLNQAAIHQMKLLLEDRTLKQLEGKNDE